MGGACSIKQFLLERRGVQCRKIAWTCGWHGVNLRLHHRRVPSGPALALSYKRRDASPTGSRLGDYSSGARCVGTALRPVPAHARFPTLSHNPTIPVWGQVPRPFCFRVRCVWVRRDRDDKPEGLRQAIVAQPDIGHLQTQHHAAQPKGAIAPKLRVRTTGTYEFLPVEHAACVPRAHVVLGEERPFVAHVAFIENAHQRTNVVDPLPIRHFVKSLGGAASAPEQVVLSPVR